MYRVIGRMSKGTNLDGTPRLIKGLTQLDWLNEGQRQKLVARGVVVKISPPPLEVLPGWSRRAKRLEKLDIVNALQFLEADVDFIVSGMNVKPATVLRWTGEIHKWLGVTEEGKGG